MCVQTCNTCSTFSLHDIVSNEPVVNTNYNNCNNMVNFKSNVIKELCTLAGVQKSRTTPYHPMGNGMTERFNQTLLNMSGTLEDRQKEDWKSFVAPLVHA